MVMGNVVISCCIYLYYDMSFVPGAYWQKCSSNRDISGNKKQISLFVCYTYHSLNKHDPLSLLFHSYVSFLVGVKRTRSSISTMPNELNNFNNEGLEELSMTVKVS